MGLTGYSGVLRRRWRTATLIVLIAVGAALLLTQVQHKRYESSGRLLVSGSSPDAPDESESRSLAAQRALLFAQLSTADAVVAAAKQMADASVRRPVYGEHVTVSARTSGEFLTITATADDPDAALAVVRAYPLVLPGQLAKLNQLPTITGGSLLTLVQPPVRATRPVEPRPVRNLLIGLGIGIVLGLGAAALGELFGRGMRDARQIQQLAAGRLLGTVPLESEDERLAAASRPQSRRSAAYREVLGRLGLTGSEAPRTVVVTSPGRREGKSTMVANLALLTGRAGRRVAVIDADLRHPGLASIFNASADAGLSDVLAGRAALADVLQPVPGERITVLAGGQGVPDPKKLLASPRMAEVLHTLTSEFDTVLIDGPPALAGTDAMLLGTLADGIVVVARPRRTTEAGLRRTLAAIGRGAAQLLGVVVNGADDTELPATAATSDAKHAKHR